MDNYLKYYDVSPRVVPANKSSIITIRGIFPNSELPPAEQMRIKCFPMSGFLPEGSNSCQVADYPPIKWRMDGDTVKAEIFFAGEQEHNLHIEFINAEKDVVLTRRFQIFSLQPDLLALTPLKGDFHVHSCRSDGREAPVYVAARYREAGFDFMAVTDHHRYAPSLEAINFWRQQPTELKLFPGEEVHSPGNPVHIINFGSSFSVNDLAASQEEQYRREVAEIADGLPDYPGQDKFPIAASEWVFDKIRAGGGLCVFCHPYWKTNRYMINESLTDAIFARKKFDAFELLGGYYKSESESNNLQVVRYIAECARGNRFPVVGLSDSHGTDTGNLFNWYYTIVLAESDEFESIKNAIKSFHSVAVEAIEGQTANIYGDFRIVRYVDFLFREYFPLHQAICAPEGKLMLELAANFAPESAAAALSALRGRVTKLREKFFQRN